MGLSGTCVWEVRPSTGNDANGGGFNTAAAGTDRSQSGSPFVTVDGSTITAVVHTTLNQFNMTGYTVTAADVGNIFNVSGGTATAGYYQITGVDTVNNRWNVDRNAGTAAQTATGRMGGAFASIQASINANQQSGTGGGNITWVKAEATISLTAALSITVTNQRNWIVGYTTTRGDNGRVTVITGAAVSGINAISATKDSTNWVNFIFDGAATSGAQGLVGYTSTTGLQAIFVNCTFKNFANEAVKTSGGENKFFYCEVTNCGGTTATVDIASTASLYGCYIHDNITATYAVRVGADTAIHGCIFANNAGAGLRCIDNATIDGCLFYGNGSDGLNVQDQNAVWVTRAIVNNIFAKNGGYGLNVAATNGQMTAIPLPQIDYNAYWSNTSGARHNTLTHGGHEIDISGTDPTNDPFVNKASKDWRLNSTAGAGALLRAAGFVQTYLGLGTVANAPDIGAYQHADPAGGGGGGYPASRAFLGA